MFVLPQILRYLPHSWECSPFGDILVSAYIFISKWHYVVWIPILTFTHIPLYFLWINMTFIVSPHIIRKSAFFDIPEPVVRHNSTVFSPFVIIWLAFKPGMPSICRQLHPSIVLPQPGPFWIMWVSSTDVLI